MTAADRARVLHEEADLIAADRRYGAIFRTVAAAVIHARADRIETGEAT
ncbi:MAG: hypothetical protein M0Z51_16615 [Propionibacterium sp.]|nr:hypothetical protein [Propionibacterium sp.]